MPNHTWEISIAWRYLFSRKGHNAINIVSGVSAAAIAVVTAAMLCILSVLNGFESLVEGMFSNFDPELRITATEGKYFCTDDEQIAKLNDLDCVQLISEQIQETALVQYDSHQTPVILLGTDENFEQLTDIHELIIDGKYETYDGDFERAVIGRGLAITLGLNAHFVGGLHLYAPKRTTRVNLMRADESFNEAFTFMAGVFAVNQVQYDDHYMLVSLPLARQLFNYNENEVTALAIKINGDVKKAQKEIQSLLGEDYIVANRYEQQASFFRIVHIEKLLTALLMVFILLIASFNTISSLSMLIIEKQESIHILSHLGANEKQIQRIFLYEGWLISSLGAISGLVIGLIICLIQEHFGLLKLGNGTDYIISAYPVVVQWIDVLLVAIIVILLGYLAALIPSKKIHTSQ